MTAAMAMGSVPASAFAAESVPATETAQEETQEQEAEAAVLSDGEDILIEELIEDEDPWQGDSASDAAPEMDAEELLSDGEETGTEEVLVIQEEFDENTLELAVEEGGTQYFYDLPEYGPQIPGWQIDLDKSMRYSYEENGEWVEGYTEITGLTVDAEESASQDAVTVEPYEDGNGWTICMNNFGHAQAALTYKLAEGDTSGLEGAESGTATYTFDIWVGGEVYGISVDSDTATNQLLPGESLTLQAEVWLDCYDEEKGYHRGDVSNVSVAWVCDADAVKLVTDGENDRSVTVTAGAETGGKGGCIRATAYVGEKEVGSCEYRINVTDGYYKIEQISSELLKQMESLAVGQSVKISPVLNWYGISDDQFASVSEVTENIRYRWEWDSNGIRIVDQKDSELFNGNENSEGNPYGGTSVYFD